MRWENILQSQPRTELVARVDNAIEITSVYSQNAPTFGQLIVGEIYSPTCDGFVEPQHLVVGHGFAGFKAWFNVFPHGSSISSGDTETYFSYENAERVFPILLERGVVGKGACKALGEFRRRNVVYDLIKSALREPQALAFEVSHLIAEEMHKWHGRMGYDMPIEDLLLNRGYSKEKTSAVLQRIIPVGDFFLSNVPHQSKGNWSRSITALLESKLSSVHIDLVDLVENVIHLELSCGLADNTVRAYEYAIEDHMKTAGYDELIIAKTCVAINPIAVFLATRFWQE